MHDRQHRVPTGTAAQWAIRHLLYFIHHYNNAHGNGEKYTFGKTEPLTGNAKIKTICENCGSLSAYVSYPRAK
jgi:hypothetical protein